MGRPPSRPVLPVSGPAQRRTGGTATGVRKMVRGRSNESLGTGLHMIVFSVLARLLKAPPFAGADLSASPYRPSRDWLERQMEPAIRAFRNTVKENLEWLLKTRPIPPPPKVSFTGFKQKLLG